MTTTAPSHLTRIEHFDAPTLGVTPAEQLRAVHRAVPEFKE